MKFFALPSFFACRPGQGRFLSQLINIIVCASVDCRGCTCYTAHQCLTKSPLARHARLALCAAGFVCIHAPSAWSCMHMDTCTGTAYSGVYHTCMCTGPKKCHFLGVITHLLVQWGGHHTFTCALWGSCRSHIYSFQNKPTKFVSFDFRCECQTLALN